MSDNACCAVARIVWCMLERSQQRGLVRGFGSLSFFSKNAKKDHSESRIFPANYLFSVKSKKKIIIEGHFVILNDRRKEFPGISCNIADFSGQKVSDSFEIGKKDNKG